MQLSTWQVKVSQVDGTLKRNGEYGTVGSFRRRTSSPLFADTETKPDVLVCASAIGYYGGNDSESFTEASPAGTDFIAEVCEEWEAAAQKANALGIRVVTVRIGLVLGLGGGLLATSTPTF